MGYFVYCNRRSIYGTQDTFFQWNPKSLCRMWKIGSTTPKTKENNTRWRQGETGMKNRKHMTTQRRRVQGKYTIVDAIPLKVSATIKRPTQTKFDAIFFAN